MIDKNLFQTQVKIVYDKVLDAFDDIDPDDAEADLSAENIKITFANRTQFILNRQGAVHQLWLATKKRGYHFNFDEEAASWICDHSGKELFALLAEETSEQMGESFTF